MTTTTDFARHLSRFLSEYLPHERNVSHNTIASYRDAFLQFVDYMKNEKGISLDRLGLKHLTRNQVLGYLKWILEVRKCSPATRNYRLAAIHSFCQYLQYAVIDMMEQWQKILTIKAMRTEGTTLNYLSTDGVKLLLAQPDTTTRNGRRHLAILSLMYDTGARVQEIADLTVDCLRITCEPYTIRLYGKGRKARIVPLVKEQVRILRQYIEENHLDDSSKGNLEMRPMFHFTERRIEAHVCICFIAYKVYKELERIIRMSKINLSVDKVLDIAKTIATINIKTDGVAGVSKRTLFLTEEQMAIKPLFDLRTLLDD